MIKVVQLAATALSVSNQQVAVVLAAAIRSGLLCIQRATQRLDCEYVNVWPRIIQSSQANECILNLVSMLLPLVSCLRTWIAVAVVSVAVVAVVAS